MKQKTITLQDSILYLSEHKALTMDSDSFGEQLQRHFPLAVQINVQNISIIQGDLFEMLHRNAATHFLQTNYRAYYADIEVDFSVEALIVCSNGEKINANIFTMVKLDLPYKVSILQPFIGFEELTPSMVQPLFPYSDVNMVKSLKNALQVTGTYRQIRFNNEKLLVNPLKMQVERIHQVAASNTDLVITQRINRLKESGLFTNMPKGVSLDKELSSELCPVYCLSTTQITFYFSPLFSVITTNDVNGVPIQSRWIHNITQDSLEYAAEKVQSHCSNREVATRILTWLEGMDLRKKIK